MLFLEDDIAITEDFDNMVYKLLRLDIELFFLGGEHEIPPGPYGEWLKCRSIKNNHTVIVSKSGARKILSLLLKPTTLWSDGEIARGLQTGQLLGLCPLKMGAFQRETRSDNSGFQGDASTSNVAREDLSGDTVAVVDALLNSCPEVVVVGNNLEILDLVKENRQEYRHLLCYTDHREFQSSVSEAYSLERYFFISRDLEKFIHGIGLPKATKLLIAHGNILSRSLKFKKTRIA